MTRKVLKRRSEYHVDHVIAKLLVCAFQIGLVVAYISTDLTMLLILMTILYYFGVNTVQYLIELVKHHSHKVGKI